MKQMEFKIEPATLADVPQIESLVEVAYQHYIERIGKKPGPMLDDYAEHVRKSRTFVARSQCGEITGLLVLIEFDGYVLLDNVAVDPSAQGQGIGKHLMSHAEQVARELGFSEIQLYTHEKMVENQAIYKKFGYEEFERRTEKGFTRVYMKKIL